MIPPAIETLFEQLDASLREPAQPLFEENVSVYIYGAGNVGKDVCRLLRGRGIRVVAFLDRNAKSDASWEKIPILLPDDKSISALDRAKSHAVIGIFNYEAEIPPIIALLKSLGFGTISTFLDLHDQFAGELGDRYWLTKRDYYRNRREEIAAGYELLSDQPSRDLYASVLRFRFSKDYAVLPNPSLGDQYFPTRLPPWPSPVRFVDCGAFDGDTLRQLVDKKIPVEAIAAFEPDPANFHKLAQTAGSRLTGTPPTVSLFPCGVSSTTTQIRFSSGGGTSSSASETGDMMIQCVALDEALTAFRPNLIKMDIEGAEYDALKGAQRIIEHHQPGLAICVYHRPDDLWNIPLLARSWVKGGRHFLRAHAHNTFELIYYWIP